MRMKEKSETGAFEFTLSQILDEEMFKVVTTYFGRKDRKVFFDKFHMSETGDGKKRKWSISKETNIIMSEFPFQDDLSLHAEDIIQDQKKQRVVLINEISEDSNILISSLSTIPSIPLDNLNSLSPPKDLKTYIQDYMKEYRSGYSEEENASYLRSILHTYTSTPTPIVQLSKRQRWHKIYDMKRSLGQCHLDEKEYSHIIITVREERLQQGAFIYQRKGIEENKDKLTKNDIQKLQIQLMFLEEIFKLLLKKNVEKMTQLTSSLTFIKKESSSEMIDIYINEYNHWINDMHKKRCLPVLVNEALSEIPFIESSEKPSQRTALRWYNDFKSNNFQGLSLHQYP